MKGLKDFRRSLNKDRTSGGRPGASAPPTFTGVKNAVSIQPPKKVIRATRDYRSRAPQELSFHKGDFFHVLSDEAGNPDWLEATNPITNARGLVPAAYFDVLTNNRPPGAGGGGGSVLSSPTLGAPPAGSMGARSGATSPAVTAKGGGGMYAIVKYDFAAERADELEAKAGESIIVIAQSNFEWFVAKPIGRLGGPGLIPVAFVEIKDLTTGRVVENVQELIESGAVPKVEEWKKMTADYKKNTIPLGRFDFQGAAPVNDSPYGQPAPDPPSKDSGYGQTQHSDQLLYQQQQEHQQMMAQQQQMQQQQQQQGQPELPPGMPPGEPLPAGIVTSATVDSFHYEQGDYWFRIQAAHVAGPSSSAPTSVPRAPAGEERDLILYRLYEDFYEFQIALLDHFPAEAGREVDANGQPSERILPLMPGPLDTVDDVITSQRRYDLDAYIVELCALPQYILRSELVRLFFEPRPGDHCTTHPLSQQAQAAAAAAARQKVDANQLGQEYDYLSSHVADEARPPVPPSNGTR
jgi:bud emergence protein 1